MGALIGFLIIGGLAAGYIALLVRQDKRKKNSDNKAETVNHSPKNIAIAIIVAIICGLIVFIVGAAIREGTKSTQIRPEPTVNELQDALDNAKAE